jgi:predicted hotdog family 3-hydroxylacyl-ACP dehydratase
MTMDAAKYVVHRKPLLLVETVLEHDAHSATTGMRVDPAAWYAGDDGAMPAWFGLELMAQTAAVFGGLDRAARGLPPRLGYLLGTRAYRCALPAFPPGADLTIHARLAYLDDTGLGAFQCRILLEGEEVATAVLKTLEEP